MYRTIMFQIIFIFFFGTFLLAQKGKKDKEILVARKIESVADSLFNDRSNFRAALDSFYKAAILFEKNRVWICAVNNYSQTALCYHFLKNNDSSQYFIDKSYYLFNKNTTGDNEKRKLAEAGIYYVRARINLRKRDFDSTFYYLNRGLEIVKKLNAETNSHNLLMAKFFQTYGSTNYAWGKYDASLKFNFQALRIRQEELPPSDLNIIDSYYNIVKVYYSKEDFEKAKQYLQYIIKYCQRKELNWRAVSYYYLGVINHRQRQFNDAINYYHKANESYLEAGDTLSSAAAMNNLGEVYALIGDFESSLEIIEKSIKIRRKFLGESHPNIARSFYSLGLYYIRIKRYDEAIKSYFDALKIIECNKPIDKLFKASIYNQIGSTYLSKDSLNKALIYYQCAIDEVVEGDNYKDEIENPKIFFKGTNILNPQLKILLKPRLLYYLINKAITYSTMYENDRGLTDKLKQAYDTYLLALQLLEIVRQDIREGESKYFLSSEFKIFFRDAINISLRLDSLYQGNQYSNTVFELIDKVKSSSLRDKYFVSNALNNSNLPKELIEHDKMLEEKLAFYNTQLKKGIQSSRNKDNNYKIEYEKLSLEFDTLSKYLEKNYPDYYRLKYEQNVTNVNNIMYQLDENTALINYLVVDTFIYIYAITNDKVEHEVVKIDSSFNEKIIDYYIDIKYGFTANELKISSEIYSSLLGPIEKLIAGKSKLLIIPDEYLYYLPFETLCKNISTTENLSDVDFLIKQYSVSYHHSATLWLNCMKKSKRQKSKNESFIGFAPVFDHSANSNPSVFSREWITDTSNVDSRIITSDLKHFNPLPHSEKEIKSIVKLFSEKKKKAVGFFYNEADEQNFKRSIKNYDFVHIASHSFTNDFRPDLSGIAFSQPDTLNIAERKTEDGILYVSETYGLDLSEVELIVLSSCKSGLGKLRKAEGFLSLSRGFLYSGVSNILFSLWSVDDEKTKDLMVEFYNQILNGTDYANSLRKAKLKLLNDNETANTKYWAPWILVGIDR